VLFTIVLKRYDTFGKRDVEVEELLQAGTSSPDWLPRNDDVSHQKQPAPLEEEEREIKKRRPRPFSALMNKNAKLQMRQWGTNLCQVSKSEKKNLRFHENTKTK
jgi:hypothetical protein